jgi:histidine ammonia-lyase
MAAAREVVESYLADGRPAYGLTTGLGARVVESLPAEALADFSRKTVLARANSVGPSLSTEVVRATPRRTRQRARDRRLRGAAAGGRGAR